MSVTHRTMGTLQPVLYFEHHITGEISIPPTDETANEIKSRMEHRGYNMKEACTLREIDALQKRIQEYEYKLGMRQLERDDQLYSTVRRSVRQRLIDRMVASTTHPWERDFIKNYLMIHDEKREHWRKQFELHRDCYFSLREYDNLNHIKEQVESVPEMSDDTCARCGKFRRVKGSELCFICLDSQ